jgi:hypothetical protein
MAIAFDTVSTTTSTTSEASWSLNHTASGSDRLAVVIVHLMKNAADGIAITTATYGGNAMTERATREWQDTSRTKTYRLSIYTYLNPPTSSTAIAIASNANSLATAIAVLSYTGVHQTTPYDANNTAQIDNTTAATVDVTTTVTDAMLVGGLHMRGGDTQPMTEGASVTERYDVESGTDTTGDIGAAGGERLATTATTYAFAFTAGAADYGVIGAIALRPASGGLGTDTQTYAWPYDYWPGFYWSEYWPDYGEVAPPSSIIPLVMHHLKEVGIS